MSSPFGEAEFLTLRIGGGRGAPERLMLIGRRREDGTVRVREWTSNSWNTEGEDYDVDPAKLLGEIEREYQARTPVSEELYRVRSWLTGVG